MCEPCQKGQLERGSWRRRHGGAAAGSAHPSFVRTRVRSLSSRWKACQCASRPRGRAAAAHRSRRCGRRELKGQGRAGAASGAASGVGEPLACPLSLSLSLSFGVCVYVTNSTPQQRWTCLQPEPEQHRPQPRVLSSPRDARAAARTCRVHRNKIIQLLYKVLREPQQQEEREREGRRPSPAPLERSRASSRRRRASTPGTCSLCAAAALSAARRALAGFRVST